MAPEQAAGGAVDRRADVWAFGVVLYEMLSGRRLFDGETVSHVLAGVLKDEPDFSQLPADTPRSVLQLVRRCLRKKPRERLQAIGDARVELEAVLRGEADEPPAAASAAAAAPSGRARPFWQIALVSIAALAVGAVGTVALIGRRAAPVPVPRTLSELPTPAGMTVLFPTLSPDGSTLAMRVTDSSRGGAQIWIRKLATGEQRALPGTGSGTRPFWSPDGQSLGYLDGAERWLKRIDLEGGRPVRLAKVGTGRSCGASWGAGGIVYCDPATAALFRVAPTGGDPVELATPAKGEFFTLPQWLDDGRRLLYVHSKEEGTPTIRVRTLDGSDESDLTATDMMPLVSGGRLYYGRGSTLLSRGFDAAAGKLREGDAEIVAEGVDDAGFGQFSVAAGLLVYAPLPERRGSRITIYDRSGKAVDRIDADGYLDDLSLSPDGRVAVLMKEGTLSKGGGETIDVWQLDLERRIFDRLTYGESDDDPVFSPDGTRIAFAHQGDLYLKPANGSGEPKLLAKKLTDIVSTDWTAEGLILYSDIDNGAEDLFAIAAGGGEPRRVTRTPFNEYNAAVSPDGRWLAYASDEGGDVQVYLTAWPSLDGKWRVSSEKSAMPRWRGDGRELFFLAHNQRLMSATVALDGRVPALGVPKPLFEVHRQVTYFARTSRWAVMPDGNRFLVLEPIEDGGAVQHPLMLVTPLAGLAERAR